MVVLVMKCLKQVVINHFEVMYYFIVVNLVIIMAKFRFKQLFIHYFEVKYYFIAVR
jgi:hypothetical protein